MYNKKTVLLTFLHLRHTYYAKHIFARFIKGLHKTDFQTSLLCHLCQDRPIVQKGGKPRLDGKKAYY